MNKDLPTIEKTLVVMTEAIEGLKQHAQHVTLGLLIQLEQFD
jgi:hypothetical protein